MPTPAYDDLYDKVPLLLHFDGSLKDDSSAAHVLTTSGSASIASAGARFGSGCASLPSGSGYIRTPNTSALSLSQELWALELQVKPAAVSAGMFLLATTSISGSGGSHMWLGFAPGGRLRWYAGGAEAYSVGPVLPTDRYSQLLARTRVNGSDKSWELFVDNTLVYARTGLTGVGLMSGPCTWNLGQVPGAFDGNASPPCLIDELRLTIGALRAPEEQTAPFANEGPPTFWPGSGASWPSGAVIL